MSHTAPVYGRDERLIHAISSPNLFLAQLDAASKPVRLEPLSGFSLFWPAMETALLAESLDAKYAGQQVIIQVAPPHDDRAVHGTVTNWDHMPSHEELEAVRGGLGLLPCSGAMSVDDLIRQGNRLNSQYRADATHCFEKAVELDPKSVAAYWGLAHWGTPEQQTASYKSIISLRPAFYEAQVDQVLNNGRKPGGTLIPELQQLLQSDLPGPNRLQALEMLIYGLHEAGRFAEETPLLDEVAGYRLRRTTLHPERIGDYITVTSLEELALHLLGAGEAAKAVDVLRVSLNIAGQNPDVYEKYVLYSLNLDHAYALSAAGRKSDAASACREISPASVPRGEIKVLSHSQLSTSSPAGKPYEVGGRKIVELRKELFCGDPAVALPSLQRELKAHPEFVAIHRVLSDYNYATGKWSEAAKENDLWLWHFSGK